MPITKYEGQTLANRVLVVEEVWLVNCVLHGCVLFYSGGPFQMENVSSDNRCQWKFSGAALQTIGLLTMIGLLRMPQTAVQITPPTGPVN